MGKQVARRLGSAILTRPTRSSKPSANFPLDVRSCFILTVGTAIMRGALVHRSKGGSREEARE
jgi:hypothetical protein